MDIVQINYLMEMALDIGANTNPRISTDRDLRRQMYSKTKELPSVDIGSTHKVKIFENRSKITYVTPDTKTGEVNHVSKFSKEDGDQEGDFSFPHLVQFDVAKNKNSDIKTDHVQNVMFHAMDKTDLPLKSDSRQYTGGHGLWKRFARTALDRGYHVYRTSGENVYPLDRQNIESHLDSYFGAYPDSETNHIVVSKNPIPASKGE